jgi:hypothetical protein
MNNPLWVRRKFFDSYGERASEQKASLPPLGIRSSCPCCGYPTLGGRGMFQICQLCSWEDDGQDAVDADEVRGDPNQSYSLTEAQENFEKHLVMYPPEDDRRIGGPDSEKVKVLKRSMMNSFDKMMEGPSPASLDILWREVQTCEKALYRELKRSITEYSS